MVKKMTISILECNGLYRMMLKRMISTISGYAMDKVYSDLESAQEQLLSFSDILIMDLESAADEEVFDFMRALMHQGVTKIIACSQKGDDSLIRRAISIGVSGYIIKESSYDEFRANLILALSGGMPLSRTVVKKLVDAVLRDQKKSPVKKLSAAVTRSCEIMEEVLAAPFSLKQENLSDHISRRVGLSYHSLSLQFKREMGITLSQYYMEKKIERVKSMIREDVYSLTQIANMLDYSSVAHLSSQFRKIVGLTPSEYKRTPMSPTS